MLTDRVDEALQQATRLGQQGDQALEAAWAIVAVRYQDAYEAQQRFERLLRQADALRIQIVGT